jgi:hypothetical protein
MSQPPTQTQKKQKQATPPDPYRLLRSFEPKTTKKQFDPTQPISGSNQPVTKAQKEAYWQTRQGLYQAAEAGNTPAIATLASQGQLWRVQKSGGAGMRLGSTSFLNPQILISIQIKYDWFNTVQQVLKSNPPFRRLTENELLANIKSQIEAPLYNYTFAQIAMNVPKDKGRLQDALRIALREHGQINSLNPFYMVLDTGRLPYAGPVNEMPDPWLQHFGTTHKGGLSMAKGRTVKKAPHALYDPTATRHWYEKTINEARTFAEVLWNRFANGYLMGLLLPVVQVLNTQQLGTQSGNYYSLQMVEDGLLSVDIPPQLPT